MSHATEQRDEVARGLESAGNIYLGLSWVVGLIGIIIGFSIVMNSMNSAGNLDESAILGILVISWCVVGIIAAYFVRIAFRGAAEMLRCFGRMEDYARQQHSDNDAPTPAKAIITGD